MASNIEHTTPESVLAAFDLFGCANFAIYYGADQRYCYEGANSTEAKEKLGEILTMIENGNSPSIYTLRVFADNETNITKKSPFKGSTTFRLQGGEVQTLANGNVLFMRDRATPMPAASNMNLAVVKEIEELKTQNRQLAEQLQKKEIEDIKKDFQNQIGELRQQLQTPDKAPFWDRVGERIGDYFAEKPEAVNDILKNVNNLFATLLGRPTQNFIQTNPVANPVNGTNKNTMSAETQQETNLQLTQEGALINPLLSAEELQLKKKQQFELIQQRLKGQEHEQEYLDELQMNCVQILENRIGAVNITHMLLAVACLDNDDLNKVLSNLS